MESVDILCKLSDVNNKELVEFNNKVGEQIFGKVILNRVMNIVYHNLKKNSSLDLGAFDKVFDVLSEDNVRKAEEYVTDVEYVSGIFEKAQFKYALLKGAFLITKIYQKGFRQSNDIDILIEEKDVVNCQQILLDNGFVQGYVKEGNVVRATRSEIIMSKMNFGETIPFCKLWNGHVISIDVNFSLDYKPMKDNKLINQMLQNVVELPLGKTYLKTLDMVDFVIHLCMHLYKEATTYDWVRRRKDLNLYKFSDLNILFHKCVNSNEYQGLINRIKAFEVEKECYFALFFSSEIYSGLKDINEYKKLLDSIRPERLDYLTQVVNPIEKKIYAYNMKFKEWFNCEDRIGQLYFVSDL